MQRICVTSKPTAHNPCSRLVSFLFACQSCSVHLKQVPGEVVNYVPSDWTVATRDDSDALKATMLRVGRQVRSRLSSYIELRGFVLVAFVLLQCNEVNVANV
jgi:hypothetical protein